MAYDAESDRVILFGGVDSLGLNNETWAYDFNNDIWTKMEPTPKPPPCVDPATAYDAESDRVIVFGGSGSPSTGICNETWAYDFNNDTWTKMEPTPKPTPWYTVAMAYDGESDRIILFGALGPDGNDNETWAYDFNNDTWTKMEPATGPSTGGGHAMAYDANSDRVVLFGGFGGGNKTWAYDFNNDTWTEEPPTASPSHRCCTAMAYDGESDRVILFGGWTGSPNGESWSYDLENNTWIALSPVGSPSGRIQHAMAYDGESDRVILFGGWTGSPNGESWSYDLDNNAWGKIGPTSPSPRCCAAMAYDSESDRVILFGGANGGFNGETWAYDFDADTWTMMEPAMAPSVRGDHGMVYDSWSDRVILFGGTSAGGANNETWAYDFNTNTWTMMDTPTAPSARIGLGMAYDSESDRVILFGGAHLGLNGDTWAYDFDTNTWTSMDPPIAPSARYDHAMAYDVASDRVLLFGGEISGLTIVNDTWSYDFNNNTWTDLIPVASPSARLSHAMAYDTMSDQLVLFGGRIDSALFSDTWTYDFYSNVWTNPASKVAPSARAGHAMTYDARSDRLVLFGGWAGHYSLETWAAQEAPASVPSVPVDLVSSAGDAEIRVTWRPPADDGGTPVTTYRIYRGTTSGDLSLFIEVGKLFGYTDTNVMNGVTYYYQVSALNRVGEGPRSTEASATPSPVNVPPAANFTFSPAAPLEGDFVAFEDTSSDPDGPGEIVSWRWDFGDVGTSAERNPAHAFEANETYVVRLTVTDSAGNTNSTAIDVVVADKDPEPHFVFTPTVPREGEAVTFSDSSESHDGIVRQSWDFGEGFNGTEQNVAHAYETDGAFVVTLTVFEADGDMASRTETVVVGDRDPVADFTWSPLTTPVEGAAVSFLDGSVSYDGIVAWGWDLDGDGLVDATVPAPAFTYRGEGVFSATLTVRERDGDFSTVTKVVTVSDDSPIARFAFNPALLVEAVPVSFQDTSISYDLIASWEWDFGDGTTSTQQNPTHVYDHDGLFVVTLNVWESDGDMSTASAAITILDADPAAAFMWTPGVPIQGAAVQFQDLSVSHDGIVGWSWDFGDGSRITSPNPSHVYKSDGTFTVTLTIQEADGDVNTFVRTVQIADVDPTAAFSFSPLNPVEGNSLTFTSASSSYDGIVSWSWDFGDGTTSTQLNPTHAYDRDRIFTVTLTVWEADGDASTVVRTVQIADVDPTAAFSFSPPNPVEGNSMTFTGASSSYDGIVSWSWDFGDGTTSTQENPTHAYDQDGTFTVTLTVHEADGDISTTSAQVRVIDSAPRADFTFSPPQPATGDAVTFSDRSVSYDGIISWEWDFGDGITSTRQDPSHVYATEGSYTVTLTVREADGDAVVESRRVTVVAGGLRLSIAGAIMIGGVAITVAAILFLFLVRWRRVRNR